MSKSDEQITKEHAIRHMEELNKGWMRQGATGLTANSYAMFLGLDVETVVSYLQEMKYHPFFCEATQAWVWSKKKMSYGYDEETGDPFTKEIVEERIAKQTKLGPGVVDNGFFKPGKKKARRRRSGLYSYYDEYTDMIGMVCGQVGAVVPKVAPTEKLCIHCLYQIPCGTNGNW